MADSWDAFPVVKTAKSPDAAGGFDQFPIVKPEEQSGSALADIGRFAATTAIRAPGALLDFAANLGHPVRTIIAGALGAPQLEHIEEVGRPHLGQKAGDAVFAAVPQLEYKPGGALDRVALNAAIGGAASGPFGLAGALAGAASGALGQTTEELTGNEALATAAGLLPGVVAPVARGTVNLVGGKARDIFGPALSQSYREGLAGEKLRNAATDLDALKSALNVDQVGPIDQSLVSGSAPTTFQLTGDMGIGQLERAARTTDAAPFLERAADQNKARVDQMNTLAPETAAPGAVRDLLKQRLDQMTADGDALVDAARKSAQARSDAAGGDTSTNYGALMRDQLEAAKASAKTREGQLWQAIDPEGTLRIGALDTRRAANQIAADTPKLAKPPEGEEATIFGQARMLPEVMPFNEFAALRGRLLQAIRDERPNGQTPALRRMQMLRNAMDETISGAAEQAAQTDAGLLGRISANVDELTGTAARAQTGTGGYNSPGASAYSAGNAPADRGGLGAAGNSTIGFGDAAGRAGVSRPPPKPQDIVEFLISRGGVRDDGGDLAAMDMNRVQGGYGTGGVGTGQFGVLSRKNGMSPDTAREYAEEAGYLRPGSTIRDLYDAIHDSSRGIPHYSDADAGIVADWEHYQKTGEAPPAFSGPALSMSDLPPNFDQAAAQRYRDAANATRDRAQTFNNPIVGPVLQEQGGGGYRMFESRVPERFISSPEGVQAFLSGGGDVATLRDALAADARRAATTPDGTIDPRKFATWQKKREAALRAFPELSDTLGNAAKAQEAVDAVSASAVARVRDFEKGAARHFLNAEPDKAVQSAFASKNPVGDFAELARLVKGDPDAKAGLQRAIADYMTRNFVGNTEAGTSGVGTLKSDAFQTFIKRHSMALGQVFSPEQVQGMRMVAADLQRSNRSIASSKLPAQSNSMQDYALLQKDGKLSVLRGPLGDWALSAAAGLGGYLLSGPVAGVAGIMAGQGKAALSSMKRAGIERVDQLVSEALLHPEVARTLIMKPSAANRPLIAGSLKTAFGRIAAAAASREAANDKEK